MVETMLAALRFVRGTRFDVAPIDERLRIAGYADGERRPRRASHWANG